MSRGVLSRALVRTVYGQVPEQVRVDLVPWSWRLARPTLRVDPKKPHLPDQPLDSFAVDIHREGSTGWAGYCRWRSLFAGFSVRLGCPLAPGGPVHLERGYLPA